MRLFKTKTFARWAKKENITDTALQLAADELSNGLFVASLGSGVYKKRVAAQRRGKQGGARVLVAYQEQNHLFFVFGFCKSEKANLTTQELLAIKKLAKELLSYESDTLNRALRAHELTAVKHD